MTTVSSEIRPFRAADSSSYRGGINGRYIKEGLNESLSRKGPCTEV